MSKDALIAIGGAFLACGGWVVPFVVHQGLKERKATRPGAPYPRKSDWIKPMMTKNTRATMARQRKNHRELCRRWAKNNGKRYDRYRVG